MFSSNYFSFYRLMGARYTLYVVMYQYYFDLTISCPMKYLGLFGKDKHVEDYFSRQPVVCLSEGWLSRRCVPRSRLLDHLQGWQFSFPIPRIVGYPRYRPDPSVANPPRQSQTHLMSEPWFLIGYAPLC